MYSLVGSIAYAQNATPPKVVTSPPNPTPTTPNPNFQYLPQKAFVIPFAPENGVPTVPPLNSPLSPTPAIQPVPVQPVAAVEPQVDIIESLGGWTGIAAMAGAVGLYLKQRVLNKVVKENSTQITKGAIVDQKIANQVYENMEDKGNSINDKPEIQLKKLADNIDEATETAAKA